MISGTLQEGSNQLSAEDPEALLLRKFQNNLSSIMYAPGLKKSTIIRFLVIRTIGNFLILFVIFGFLATFGPVFYYEAQFRINQFEGVKYQIADAEKLPVKPKTHASATKSGQLISTKTPTPIPSLLSSSNIRTLVPVSTNFSIIIPKFGINENVFPNVDPGNPKEFLPILQKGVAHAKGSALPGLDGTTYLFAHSTDNFWDVGRYNAIFYLIKDLMPNDEIVVYYNNQRYDYTVYNQKIVEATNTTFMKANLGKGDILILQTCWPPGTTWKRLLVFAKLKPNLNDN